jgi:hypothetical protein
MDISIPTLVSLVFRSKDLCNMVPQPTVNIRPFFNRKHALVRVWS